jgi:psp operon transcriptional activator
VIEYGEFERVGGSETIRTNVRIIGATNDDLPALTKQGKFRADLLDRLAFDVITLPPLRERPGDIMTLAEHFAVKMTVELGQQIFNGFSEQARNALMGYRWPGNIRELKNVVERAVYSCQEEGQAITGIVFDPFESPWRTRTEPDEDKPESSALPREPYDLKQSIQDEEVRRIKHAMELCRFNQKKTAEFLGMTYHQLRGYLRKYELTEHEE